LGRRRQCVGDPGTGLVELALAAGQILDRPTLAELTIHAPLVVATPGTALQVVVSDPASDAPAVTIFGRERPDLGSWTMHAEGRLAAARTMAESKVGAPGPAAQTLPVDDVYAVLTDRGFTYGPAFQAVTAAWREGSDLVASLDVTGLDLASHVVHPVLLDAAMHVLAVGGLGAAETPDSALVPFVWSVVRVGPAARATRSPRGCPRRTAWPMPSASL
jgi:acyl transferase domain-containing protein